MNVLAETAKYLPSIQSPLLLSQRNLISLRVVMCLAEKHFLPSLECKGRQHCKVLSVP